MRAVLLVSVLTAWAGGVEAAEVAGKAQHVVVIVWDGMRPDLVTPQYAPTLFDLARKGTFFKHNHAAYVSSTEVNGTVLATGMQPDHGGVMANTEYRPDLNWLTSYGTESLDAVRRGDLLTHGRYLEAATVAEILHQAGFATVIADAKPVAILHDRSSQKVSAPERESVTLFRGQSIPRSVAENLAKLPEIGPFPAPLPFAPGSRERTSTNPPAPVTEAVSASADTGGGTRKTSATPTTPDSWTTKALTRGLWRKSIPKYSLLWLSEPDAAQHLAGLGSETAIAAMESSDKNLAAVLKTLEEKDASENTDIFIVSDHGFSTIDRGPDIVEMLKKSKFVAAKQFQNPESGDIMVVSLGGRSVLPCVF